jgi:uncharacterized protein YlaI
MKGPQMANTTNELISGVELTYNGVNYRIDAEFIVNLDDGTLTLDDVYAWICDAYWESVTGKTFDLHAMKLEPFREAITDACKDRIDIDHLREIESF